MTTNQPNIEYVIQLNTPRPGDKYITFRGVGGRNRRACVIGSPADIFVDYNSNRALVGWKTLSAANKELARCQSCSYPFSKIVSFDLNATPCVPVEVPCEG